MQLKRIQLKHFGRLHDFTADFEPGLNVIRGPNESGKSTLHQALIMALMEKPSKKQENGQWRNWNSNSWYWLGLDFADRRGDLYRIKKDFDSVTQELELPGRATTRNPDAINETMEAVLGTRSLIVVQSTLCVKQDSLADIASGRSEISQSLEAIVTGGEADVHTGQAIRKLENTVNEFRRGLKRHSANPGQLAWTRDEKDRLEKQVHDIKTKVNSQESDVLALEDTKARLQVIDHKLGPLKTTVDQAESARRINADLKKYEDEEEDLHNKVERAKSAEKERDEAAEALADLGAVAQLTDEEKSQIDQLASRIKTLEEEQARYRTELEQYDDDLAVYREQQAAYNQALSEYEADKAGYEQEWSEYHIRLNEYEAAFARREADLAAYEARLAAEQRDRADSRPAGGLWIALIAGGFLVAAAGALFATLANNPSLGFALLVIGLLLAVIGVWQRQRRARNVPQSFEQLNDATAATGEFGIPRPGPLVIVKPEQPNRQQPMPPPAPMSEPAKPSFNPEPLQETNDDLRRRLTAAGCESPIDLSTKYSQAQALRTQQQAASSRLEGLLGNSTLEELEQERRNAGQSLREAKDRLKAPELQRALLLTPRDYNEYVETIRSLESERASLAETQLRLEGKLQQQPVSHEDLLRAEEALESARKAYERAQMRDEVYELTLSMLKKAREQTLEHARQRLGPATATYLSALTNGRYQNVWVDSDLGIELEDPEQPGRRVLPERLSRGAQDQLYMAARLALVDALFPNTKPPVILDDPFVHFDAQRLAAAIDMCCEIAEERQVLLFTCSGNYNHVGHHIMMPSVQSTK